MSNKSKALLGALLIILLLGIWVLSRPSIPDFNPPIEMGGRVTELVNGEHLDHLLGDTPDEMRPPSVVVFFDSSDGTCMRKFNKLKLQKNAEEVLPPRERLLIAKYDTFLASRRPWFKFTPERDLATRFGVSACPSVVFLPRNCAGNTTWCERPDRTVGCADFVESCRTYKTWSGDEDWVEWVQGLVAAEPPQQISRFIGTFARLGQWLRARDECTNNNYLRNLYLPPNIPNFTATGYKLLPIPQPLYEALLLHVHTAHKNLESWSASGTQNSFHVTKMYMYDVNQNHTLTELANTHLKPILEEWSGLKGDLDFSSFYGVREYQKGHWLRGHIDRTDVLVISATMCIEKPNTTADAGEHWPLEVVDWEGRNVRSHHPPGTVFLYESAKLIHGRPQFNEDTHLGVFLHYKPHSRVNWGEVSARAEKSVREHQRRLGYRATPSTEPDSYAFTEVNYGEDSRWDL